FLDVSTLSTQTRRSLAAPSLVTSPALPPPPSPTPAACEGGSATAPSACAKAGVVCMTRTLAVEWARYKIRVNAIAPGPVETEGAGSKLWATPEVRTAMLKTVPRGRIGTPEEIAQASAYLVSDFADFIT